MDKKLTKLVIFLSMFLCLSFFINLIPPAQAVQELTINTTENGTDATFSTFQGKDSLGENIWIGGGGLKSVGSRDYDFFGSKNSAFGFKALTDLSIGYNNSAFGNQALTLLSTGFHNVALGNSALGNLNDGSQNIAIGSLAGLVDQGDKENAIANNSVYLGFNTKPAKNDETNQIIIGSNAIGSGSNSVTLGNDEILKTILKGNIGIGQSDPNYLLEVNGQSYFSQPVIVGTPVNDSDAVTLSYLNSALSSNSSWTVSGANLYNNNNGNVGIGTTTPTEKLDVAGNIILKSTVGGTSALISTFQGVNSDGNNIFIGGGGQQSIGVKGQTEKGSNNTAYGINSLNVNTTGNGNTAVGGYSLYRNTTGSGNTANGFQSLGANTAGNNNTANGVRSLFSNTTGSGNTANGFYSLYSNTTGSGNTANGFYSLYSNTTGYFNTANGDTALFSNTTGINNTAIGNGSLYNNTSGGSNTAIGHLALLHNTTGFTNSAIGYLSLSQNVSGNSNVAMGYNSAVYTENGDFRTTGNYGIYLGENAKASANGTNNEIVIGYNANGNGSNSVTLGNDNILKTILKGNIGIGQSDPSYLLEVNGQSYFSQPVIVGTPVNDSDAVTLSYLNSALSSNSSWTVSGANLYNNNAGNVGIGVNNPATKLEVNSGNGDDTELRISADGGSRPTLSLFENSTSKLDLMYNTGIAYIRTGDNFGTGVSMYFQAKNLTRLAIDGETGNIGVGITNPGQQLEITKNFKLPATTGTTPYGIIYKGTVPFLHNFNYGNNGTVTTLGSNLFLGLNSGNFSLGSTATDMTQGSWNIGLGDYALNALTSGYGNTALGYNALPYITTGSSNVAVGTAAGRVYGSNSNNLSPSDSVFIGAYTKSFGADQANEIVIGSLATGNGSNSVTLGNASITKTILRGNVGIGTTTPTQALDVLGRIAVNGKIMLYLPDQTNYLGTLYLGSAGGANLSRGSDSYPSNGQFNTYLGIGSGFYNTFGYENVGIGYNSLNKNTEGKSNIAIGAYAMENNLTGTSNIALGRNSLQANTSGKENTALGTNALLTNSAGENNTAVGFRALEKNTIGADNTAFGYLAMRYNNTGSDNVVIGQRALYYSSTTSNTVSIGRYAGYNQMGGSNIFIGSGAGFTDPAVLEYITGSVVIGVNARAYADNQVVLGGDSILSTILKGKVGLGTTTPSTAQLVIATSTTAYSFDSNGYLIKNVGTPILATDAANKSYVDSALAVLSPNFIRRAVNDVDATATSTDNMISYTNISVSRTVTIPATVCSAGKRLTIADESGALSPTKTITIAPTGGTISGTSTQTIYEPYNNMSIYCSGTGNAWYIY